MFVSGIENVEFVNNSAVIPDSGTAKVRARPVVKHFSTVSLYLHFLAFGRCSYPERLM